jgi:beta-1,2-mannosidase
VRHDTLFLLFRAEDSIGRFAGTSRIGLAYSTDGLHFTPYPEPVLYPQEDVFKKWEWEGGCEDPRVVQDEKGTYYMTYTSYDGDKARLLVASSPDLVHWTKHGPAFSQAHSGKYENFWSKSGAIVSRYEGENIIATKVNGKYWMYWGDQNIWAATSNDLVNWTPVVDSTQRLTDMELRGIAKNAPELKVVFGPRRGKFDSDLVEPGPPALLTDSGIVLIYNSRNIPSLGDPTLPEGTYAAGQILMDRNDPTRVLDRLPQYFMRPDRPYEISGQVNHVCFVEGLVRFHDHWHLYYGTADSKIAVAVKP